MAFLWVIYQIISGFSEQRSHKSFRQQPDYYWFWLVFIHFFPFLQCSGKFIARLSVWQSAIERWLKRCRSLHWFTPVCCSYFILPAILY
jgi:hypothetical protein